MGKYLNDDFWRDALMKPDWYLYVQKDFKRLEELAKQKEGQSDEKEVKGEAYALVEEALAKGTVPLADQGEDLDRERQVIDTIVIHHTKNKPGMSLERLNAMQLLRLYGRRRYESKKVWSNHFYEERQVFWAYHWFVRQNGEAQHILKDDHIAWHAGSWDVNTRSIAICIDNDLRNKQPKSVVINKIAEIIKQHYSFVLPENIIGHYDVNPKTECPGRLFKKKWRSELLGLL